MYACLLRRMVDAANFVLLDEVLDQLSTKPHDAGSQPQMGSFGGLLLHHRRSVRRAILSVSQTSAAVINVSGEKVCSLFTLRSRGSIVPYVRYL